MIEAPGTIPVGGGSLPSSGRGLRIEVFSCSGGLAAGFRAAGLPFDVAFDRDEDACRSYEANLGTRPVQIDVCDLLCMARMGWRPGPVDLLVADPPCAPWSRAGKRRGLDDERDALAETVEFVTLLRPRAALIGNIPGLDDAPNLGIVQKTIGGLTRHGYCVRDFASIDAAAFGVPQHRVRPFWYAHRDGACIRWPEPTHGPVVASLLLPGVAALRPYVTCREALAHVPLEELGRPVRLRHEGQRIVPRHPPSDVDAPARTVTASGGGGSKRSRPATTVHCDPRIAPPGHHAQSFLSPPEPQRPKRDPSTRGPQSGRIGVPDEPARTLDTRVARAGSGDNGTLAWPWDRPTTTVCAAIDKIAPAEEHGGQFGPNAIILSERAAAVLQGFSDGWVFVGKTKASRWAQIGQAVPPIVAEAIARAVKVALAIE